jgi:hypothetical protein
MMTAEQARAANLLPPTSEPVVACVMLVDGRRDMVKRAIASFRSQTYQRKRLLIVASDLSNNGIPICWLSLRAGYVEVVGVVGSDGIHRSERFDPQPPDFQINFAYRGTVGELRNFGGLGCRSMGADVVAHWDSDDWSHPKRLEEQVAHLLASWPRQCVGYNKMLFWDTTRYTCRDAGQEEAWLYANDNPAQPLGTSLMYWREAWERNPFQSLKPSTGGEDVRFLDKLKPFATSVSSLRPDGEPRMIAAIHGANTSSRIIECKEWIRVREYDEICRKTMAL